MSLVVHIINLRDVIAHFRDTPSAPHETEDGHDLLPVGQRLVVKANKAVRARNVQVKAMASKPKVITKAADLNHRQR